MRLIMGGPTAALLCGGILEDREIIAASSLILPNLSKTSSRGGGKLLTLAPHLRQIALFIACLLHVCG